ncbi:MAG: hypothetical protein ACTTGX_06655, partial [Candidatus Cryptobacteroides sp.]
NDRTDANDEVVIKSVYDPSPVGYSLPASNAFTGFTTTGGNAGDWYTPVTPEERAKFNVKGNWDKGWYFYTKPDKQGGTIFFFSAVGRRYLESGRLLGVNTSGWCWTTGPTNPGGGHLLNFASEYVYPLHGHGTRSDGLAVRSAEEKKWRCVVVSYNVLTSAALHPSHARRGSPPFMMSWMTQSHIVTPTTHKKFNALKRRIKEITFIKYHLE